MLPSLTFFLSLRILTVTLFTAKSMQATRAVSRVVRPAVQRRSMSTGGPLPNMLDKYVWRKSTISYITYIVVGCVAIEAIFGNVSQNIWDSANQGKQFKSVDWSKFKATEDDDEDEEEEEEDE